MILFESIVGHQLYSKKNERVQLNSKKNLYCFTSIHKLLKVFRFVANAFHKTFDVSKEYQHTTKRKIWKNWTWVQLNIFYVIYFNSQHAIIVQYWSIYRWDFHISFSTFFRVFVCLSITAIHIWILVKHSKYKMIKHYIANSLIKREPLKDTQNYLFHEYCKWFSFALLCSIRSLWNVVCINISLHISNIYNLTPRKI